MKTTNTVLQKGAFSMDRKYSIGFSVGILASIIVIIFGLQIYKSQQSPHEDQFQKTQAEEIDNGFYLKNINGFITVYDSNSGHVFEETSIRYEDLPDSVQKQIKTGYRLETETDVYSFLENYSS